MIAMLTSSFSALPALGKLFSIDMGIQYVGFTFAWILRTEKFYDLTGISFPQKAEIGKTYTSLISGSVTFCLMSYLSHSWSTNTLRQFVNSHMVIGWACRYVAWPEMSTCPHFHCFTKIILHFFRLGLYLFLRILKDGKDKRFDQAKTDPVKFFTFWTLQGNMENSQTSPKWKH